MGGRNLRPIYSGVAVPGACRASGCLPCLNLGTPSAGVYVFLRDDEIMRLASAAQVTVVQVTGAHNMTQSITIRFIPPQRPFYSPSKLLCSIYPEVDFAEFQLYPPPFERTMDSVEHTF